MFDKSGPPNDLVFEKFFIAFGRDLFGTPRYPGSGKDSLFAIHAWVSLFEELIPVTGTGTIALSPCLRADLLLWCLCNKN